MRVGCQEIYLVTVFGSGSVLLLPSFFLLSFPKGICALEWRQIQTDPTRGAGRSNVSFLTLAPEVIQTPPFAEEQERQRMGHPHGFFKEARRFPNVHPPPPNYHRHRLRSCRRGQGSSTLEQDQAPLQGPKGRRHRSLGPTEGRPRLTAILQPEGHRPDTKCMFRRNDLTQASALVSRPETYIGPRCRSCRPRRALYRTFSPPRATCTFS